MNGIHCRRCALYPCRCTDSVDVIADYQDRLRVSLDLAVSRVRELEEDKELADGFYLLGAGDD